MDKKENIEIIGSGKSITYLIGGTLIGCSSESFRYLFEKNLVENIHSIMILTMDSDHMGGVSSFIDYNRSSDKILNIYAPDGFLSYYNILNISKTTNGTIIDFFISTISHNTVYNITGVKYHFVEMSHINNVQNYGILLNKKKSVFISGYCSSKSISSLNKYINKVRYSFIDMNSLPSNTHPSESLIYKNTSSDDDHKIFGVSDGPLKYFEKATIGNLYEL